MQKSSALMAEFIEFRATGDPRLRDELVKAHLGLAYAIARRFEGRGEEREDLRQVALIALTRAVERFEPERGVTFSTYAAPTIAGSLKRHLRDHSWIVRPPRAVGERVMRVAATSEELTNACGHEPSIDELATAGGWTRDEVEEATSVLHAYRRYEAKSLDESAVAQLPSAYSGDSASDDRLIVEDLLAGLDERKRRIVKLRYYSDLSQTAIAREIGVSQMQVSRLLAASSDKLRALAGERALALTG
jgi:RNA polymerase sigma-B factor